MLWIVYTLLLMLWCLKPSQTTLMIIFFIPVIVTFHCKLLQRKPYLEGNSDQSWKMFFTYVRHDRLQGNRPWFSYSFPKKYLSLLVCLLYANSSCPVVDLFQGLLLDITTQCFCEYYALRASLNSCLINGSPAVIGWMGHWVGNVIGSTYQVTVKLELWW